MCFCVNILNKITNLILNKIKQNVAGTLIAVIVSSSDVCKYFEIALQLLFDIAVTSVGFRVEGTTDATVICYLHSQLKECYILVK